MVSSAFKPAVNGVIEPIARAASKAGITPNAVTVVGTIGTTAAIVSTLFTTVGLAQSPDTAGNVV